MLVRNYIEVGIIVILVIVGVIFYIHARNKADDLESRLMIRKKKDIHENLEKNADIDDEL